MFLLTVAAVDTRRASDARREVTIETRRCVMRRRTPGNSGERSDLESLELTLTCAWCGKPIVLEASTEGVRLPDRDLFISAHSRCLRSAAPTRSSAPG